MTDFNIFFNNLRQNHEKKPLLLILCCDIINVPRVVGAGGACFLDTEEVTGSIPVQPTKENRVYKYEL